MSKVRAVQALVDEDVSVGEIASRLGLKPYPARKQAAQARSLLGRPSSGRRSYALPELDHALKGGQPPGSELQLQRAIVEVTETSAAGTGG